MITRHFPTKIMHRAVEHDGVLHLSGVIADDLSKDMQGQAEEVFRKIETILRDLGSSKEKLLSATVYISDFSQKDGMNEAWFRWLPGEHLPARATIGVAELGKGVLIEVVACAAR